MKNSKDFLIISLIVHLLIFIVLTYIVLPPVIDIGNFLDGIAVDIVELRPIIRKERLPEPETEETADQAAETEIAEPKGPQPPEPAGFSLSPEVSRTDRIKAAYSDKKGTRKILPAEGGIVSKPLETSKPVPLSDDGMDIAKVKGLDEDERSLSDAGDGTGFSGSEVGPIRSGGVNRGGTTEYVLAVAPMTQEREKGNEFADIMPELARSIIKRMTQKRMDVVFVIDTTGSMRDNVRGVRDYISSFLEPIKDEDYDAALGLVEFTDDSARKAKIVGLTRSQKEFRKWLDRTRFFGGEDIPESGYEAIISAMEGIEFRKGTQKFFIFVSDAPQHDIDYDGKSKYSLDRVIAMLNDAGVMVNVIGANYLPMKQLAWGSGGEWKHIPGGDPITDIPHPTSSMIRSSLSRSVLPAPVEDKVTIEYGNSTPDWIDLSYKMLDPLGLKCLGTLTYRKKVSGKAEKKVEFFNKIDLTQFKDRPGIYTLIYRVRDSIGNWDILRRTLELQSSDS